MRIHIFSISYWFSISFHIRNTIPIQPTHSQGFFWFSISFHFVPRNEVGQVRGRIHGDAQEGTRGRCIRKKSFLGGSPHFRFLVSQGGYKPVVTRITHESGTCSPGFLTIKWDDPSKKGVGMLWGDGICHPWTPAVKDSMFSWQIQWISFQKSGPRGGGGSVKKLLISP